MKIFELTYPMLMRVLAKTGKPSLSCHACAGELFIREKIVSKDVTCNYCRTNHYHLSCAKRLNICL